MEATTAQAPIGGLAGPARLALSLLRWTAACLLTLAAVAAGVGVLYLIRRQALLAVGPGIPGALPLQQLAGGEAQPLLRLAIAWLPAGFVAGLAVAYLTRLGSVLRITATTVLAWIAQVLAGGAADAIAITDPVGPHLLPQLARVGTWFAVALFAAGSLLADRFQASGE